MNKELCGHPTKNGPCTLAKGHTIGYHRHRTYSSITWTIETDKGVKLESGKGRVELNYAITRCMENNGYIVIHIKEWDTVNGTPA